MSGPEAVKQILIEPSGRGARLEAFVRQHARDAAFPHWLEAFPPRLRFSAVARALPYLPDQPQAVEPLLNLITRGLSRSKSLQKLIELQSRVEVCRALDARVEQLAKCTKLACPKCPAKLNRATFIRHLWFKHRLVFEAGQAREPGALIEPAIQTALSSDDPKALDRVYHLAAIAYEQTDPAQVHQAITSRCEADREELVPLEERARERNCGLCPRCLSAMPAAPALPTPLALSESRLMGEGFEWEIDPHPGRNLTFLLATSTAVVTLLLAPLLRSPWLVAVGIVVVLGLYLRRGRRNVMLHVVDAAWRDLVPRVGRSPAAIRFLTRLCRTSLTHGDVRQRTEAVWTLFEQAALLSGKGPAHLQLFAAVSVLRAHDAGAIGGDWLPQLVEMITPLFRAEAPIAFADAVAQTLHESDLLDDPAAARLRILLVNAAFANGLSPADLGTLIDVAPHLGPLFAGNQEWFETLFTIWRKRAGDAITVFDYALNPASGRTLASYPDTLLVYRFEESFDRELGPVLIGRRGVTISDVTMSDLNTAIDVKADGDGSVLHFGGVSLATRRRLPKKMAVTLTNWLQFREDLLSRVKETAPTRRLRGILASASTDCLLCRTRSVVKRGHVNFPLPNI